jgi:histidinol phosphatase-like enzyme (inositol monophosphatase family)
MASIERIDACFFEHLSRVARLAIEEVSSGPFRVQNKGETGFDPVTDADRTVELSLRSAIAQRFPDDDLSGEEFGSSPAGAARHWSIDPIDGTRAFICGIPSWSILVGVVEGGERIAGMIDLPATDELFIAVDGETTRNGAPVQTSGQRTLEQARFSTTDPFLFVDSEFEAFNRIRRTVQIARYGLDGSAYARLAAGGLDLVVESGLKPHDYDALVPVVRGAGGHFGDWEGGDNIASGRIIAAASRELYVRTVELIQERS